MIPKTLRFSRMTARRTTSRRTRAPHVLIIADAENFLLIARLLRDFDCEVEAALDAFEGLAAARRRKPDAIIADDGMPGMNGFELVERLRGDEELSAVPRIVATGPERAEALDEVFRLETSALLRKPVTKAALLSAFDRALGRTLALTRTRASRAS